MTRLESLSRLLTLKVSITFLFWCFPLLTFPASWFTALGVPAPAPMVFARLLGAAYMALIIGYLFGIRELRHNRYPVQAVWMGIGSNGSASFLLTYYALIGSFQTWSTLGQIFIFASAFVTFCIAALLLRFHLLCK